MAFVFKGGRVFDAAGIKDRVPTYFKGCSATIHKIIERKSIPKDAYYFASHTQKSGWKEVSETYKARKLLLKEEWVASNVPGYGNPDAKLDVLPAPPLLLLEDHEKFTDDTGKPYDIEVRGERAKDKIFFRAKDVETMLELGNIRSSIQECLQPEDHKTFIPTGVGLTDNLANRIGQETTYLTYAGLVKLIMRRRDQRVAERFQRWAVKTLFVVQLGTAEQKQGLSAELLGVDAKALRAVLNCSASTMPCVYLFALGRVKGLRRSLDIDAKHSDDHVVLKYGMTEDLARRTGEHARSYGRLPGADLKLRTFVLVDPANISKAEAELRAVVARASWQLGNADHKELMCVPDGLIDSALHSIFKGLGTAYAGRLHELQQRLDHEIALRIQLEARMAEKVALQSERLDAERAHARERDALKDLLLQQKDELIAVLKHNRP